MKSAKAEEGIEVINKGINQMVIIRESSENVTRVVDELGVKSK